MAAQRRGSHLLTPDATIKVPDLHTGASTAIRIEDSRLPALEGFISVITGV